MFVHEMKNKTKNDLFLILGRMSSPRAKSTHLVEVVVEVASSAARARLVASSDGPVASCGEGEAGVLACQESKIFDDSRLVKQQNIFLIMFVLKVNPQLTDYNESLTTKF
jgi:hypothetical protein